MWGTQRGAPLTTEETPKSKKRAEKAKGPCRCIAYKAIWGFRTLSRKGLSQCVEYGVLRRATALSMKEGVWTLEYL